MIDQGKILKLCLLCFFLDLGGTFVPIFWKYAKSWTKIKDQAKKQYWLANTSTTKNRILMKFEIYLIFYDIFFS